MQIHEETKKRYFQTSQNSQFFQKLQLHFCNFSLHFLLIFCSFNSTYCLSTIRLTINNCARFYGISLDTGFVFRWSRLKSSAHLHPVLQRNKKFTHFMNWPWNEITKDVLNIRIKFKATINKYTKHICSDTFYQNIKFHVLFLFTVFKSKSKSIQFHLLF